MFNATVAQKPTMAVNDGTKSFQKSGAVFPCTTWKVLAVSSTWHRPPACFDIQKSNSRPTASMNGAETTCRALITSIPRHTTYILTSQKAKKHTQIDDELSAIPGTSTK